MGRWSGALQAALRHCAPTYATYFGEGKLGPAELRLVRCGTFDRLCQEALARGAAAGQYKPPVVAKKVWERELLEAQRWLPQGAAR
jgi:hypothetical protein